MTGRVVIITGANAGLGYEVAKHLCEGGNDVILACRSEEKGNHAIEKIKRQNPNALATFMKVSCCHFLTVTIMEKFRILITEMAILAVVL